MLRNMLILASLLCAITSTLSAQTAQNDGAETSSRRVSKAAPATPITKRLPTLPVGWFGLGKKQLPTGADGQQVRTAAHYDTTGEPSEKSSRRNSGAASRLQRIRRSVVFDNLPNTKTTTGSNTTGASSKTPLAPKSTPRVTSSGQSAEQSADAPATSTNATFETSARDSQKTQPLDSPPDPRQQTFQDSTAISPQADIDTATDGSEDKSPRFEKLPSIVNRSTIRQDSESVTSSEVLRDGSMELTPIDEVHSPSSKLQDTTLIATPMASSEISPVKDPDHEDEILISNESPVLSVQTRGPKTIVVGKTASFHFQLVNRGEVEADDVIVQVNIPNGVEIANTLPTVGSARMQPNDQGESILEWSVGKLRAGGRETMQVDIVPRGSRPLDLAVNWTFVPRSTTAQVQVQEPKLAMSVIGPQDVLYEETKVYTITVSNPGTGDAENVVLNLLPLIPSERSAGVRQLGSIPAGTRRTIEVELTARQTGRLQVRAEATADGGLRAQAHQDVLVRRASLQVQVEGPPMKYAGTRARYMIRISNVGDATARDIVAVANVPAAAKKIATTDGGTFEPKHGQVHWTVGTLRPGGVRVLEMECILMSAGNNRIDVRTVANGNLSALGSAVTAVESLADLKMTVNDPKGAVAVGADVVYEVRIVNRGTKAAQNIQVFGYFSEGVEPVAIRGWRGAVEEGEVTLERIPRLGAGQEMVLKITAQARRSGDHVFRAELECNDPETKLAVEEWTRFYGDRIPVREARRPQAAKPAPAKQLRR